MTEKSNLPFPENPVIITSEADALKRDAQYQDLAQQYIFKEILLALASHKTSQ